MNHPEFKIADLHLTGLTACPVQALIDFYQSNIEHLKASMPKRDATFYSNAYWQYEIAIYQELYQEKKALRFALMESNRVIGIINFDQIQFGSFCACYLGYVLDYNKQGKGYMSQALVVCIEYVFKELKLNRIMANYVPTNIKSAALLKRLGFEKEGYAKKYLKLDGQWQNHVLTSLVR